MNDGSTLSYEQITAITEREISSYVSLAVGTMKAQTSFVRDARRYTRGMFLNWMALTEGIRREVDLQRLEALLATLPHTGRRTDAGSASGGNKRTGLRGRDSHSSHG